MQATRFQPLDGHPVRPGAALPPRRRTSAAPSVLVLALVLSAGLQGGPARAADGVSLGSVAIVHGQVFDSRAQPLKVDAALLQRLQQASIEQLQAQSPAAARQQALALHQRLLGALQKTTTAEGAPHPDTLLANALLIDQLGRLPGAKDSAQVLRANVELMRKVMGSQTLAFDADNLVAHPQLTRQTASAFKRLNLPLPLPLPFPKPFPRPYTYSARCAAAGVPVPPAFNSNGSTGWKREGSLNFSILNPGQFSELYTYTPANGQGLCMALPIRANANQATYDALGIICQGLSTGANLNVSNSQSCYWDNATTSMVPNTSYAINGPTFIAPPNLPSNNQCTDCHAGENAFITHTGSVIETAKQAFNQAHPANNFTTRNNWPTPRVDVTWPQNPEPPASYNGGNGLPTAACSNCHVPSFAGRLPDVTGAAGSNPGRDKLFLFCWAIASGQITAGTGPHAASVGLNGMTGPMHGNTGAGNADLAPVHQACNSVIPVFMGFPANATAWVNW